jgi:hypothetical protein
MADPLSIAGLALAGLQAGGAAFRRWRRYRDAAAEIQDVIDDLEIDRLILQSFCATSAEAGYDQQTRYLITDCERILGELDSLIASCFRSEERRRDETPTLVRRVNRWRWIEKCTHTQKLRDRLKNRLRHLTELQRVKQRYVLARRSEYVGVSH